MPIPVRVRKGLFGLSGFLLMIVIILGTMAYFRIPIFSLSPFDVVPTDAVFLIETEKPIKNWKEISQSEAWLHLQKHPYVAEITSGLNTLDKVLKENEALFDILGEKTTVISIHNRPNEEDFDLLYVVDIERIGGFSTLLSEYIQPFFAEIQSNVTSKKVEDFEVYMVYDPKDKSTLYLSFVDNLIVCSYSQKLLLRALEQRSQPSITTIHKFQEIFDISGAGKLAKFFIQYEYFDDYMQHYMLEKNEYLSQFAKSLWFTGSHLEIDDNQWQLEGHTNVNDSVNSFLKAASLAGTGDITAPRIIPQEVSAYMSLNFEDFPTYYENLDAMWQTNVGEYEEYMDNLRKVEKFLDISVEEQFMSWIHDEIGIIQLKAQPNTQAKDNMAILIKAKEINDARQKLEFVTAQVRKKSPVKFKHVDYKGYGIHFLHMKGLFKLFLGKYFDKIEKPFFTYIEDYVVFANNPETLKTIIDSYALGFTLAHSEGFVDFYSHFSQSSSIFTYINTPIALENSNLVLDSAMYQSMQQNRKYLICFPHIGFQLKDVGENRFDTRMAMSYLPAEEVENNLKTFAQRKAEKMQSVENENTFSKLKGLFGSEDANATFRTSDFQLLPEEIISIQELNENSGLRKMQQKSGDTLKVFYMAGKELDGVYQEYVGNVLRIKGKYRKNQKAGIWKYYDEDGELEEKKHYKNGEEKFW